MTGAVRILLGDTLASARRTLESICRDQGWELLAVESSFQVLRMIRDTSDIALVLVAPGLPGSGVSGRDVARTIKGSAQFQSIPVMFVVHAGEEPPPTQSVNGIVEIDRWGPSRLLSALREAMGLVSADAEADAEARVESSDEPVPVAASGGVSVARAVDPGPEPPVTSGRRARVVVADAAASTRALLEPLCAHQGWEAIFVESGFQALRVIRDSDVDLVLINPALQAAGVSGADIARTIKGASQFRKLPLLFLLHPGEPAPRTAGADGTVHLDPSQPARILSALNAAMGRPAAALDDATLAASLHAEPAPREPATDMPHEPAVSAEPVTTEQPAPVEEPIATAYGGVIPGAPATVEPPAPRAVLPAPAAALEGMVADEVRRLIAHEARPLLEEAVGAISRDVVAKTAQRVMREEIGRLTNPAAVASELASTMREPMLEELRRAIETVVSREAATEGRALIEAVIRRFAEANGQGIAEQVAAAVARDMVPGIVEQVVQQEMERRPVEDRPAPPREGTPADASAAIDAAVRQYVAAEGRLAAERAAAAVAREVVPGVAERLIREQLPSPTAKVNELLSPLREQLVLEARRAVEGIARQSAETDGRVVVEHAMEHFVATQARGIAEEMLRAAARELVPAFAERLVQQELARLPTPAATVEELLPQVRERMLQEARQAAERTALQHMEAEARAVLDAAARQFMLSEGRRISEPLVSASANEVVPALAERLIREELARLPGAAVKLDELLAGLRADLLQDARRTLEVIAFRYAETEGRTVVQDAIREYAQVQARTADDVVRVVAREVIPAIAERLIRDEIARLRAEYRLD